jgi:hypothetical protein
MFKNLTTVMLTALVVVAINIPVIEDADAKGFSSSRSSFSSSSYSRKSSSSSFSSYKSKSTSTKSTSTKTTSTKTTSKPKASANTKTTSSKFGGKGKTASYKTVTGPKQTKQAKSALKSQRAKFKKPAPKTSSASIASNRAKYRNNSTYSAARKANPSTYYSRRNSYYAGYNTPSYVYYGSPSYGMWDTLFLYSLLSNNNNNHAGQFAHNYANDADYQQWRREADTLAKDNAELRAQLATLDGQAAKLAGTPVVAGYVPEGVDADIMLSPETLTSMKPTMKVCVGSQSGAYFRVVAGIMAPGNNTVNMVAVTTQGTGETLANIANGTCDAGMVQGDGYWNYVEEHQTESLPFERVFTPYKEAVHLVCNDKGPSRIAELSDKNKVYFPAGSGAAETWKNFSAESDKYKNVKTVLNTPSMNVASYEEAMLKVTSDKNACAVYVAAPGSTTLMRNIDAGAKSSKLILADIEDSTLDNTTDPSGADVYSFKQIDSYKELQRKGSCYGYCAGSIDTLFVNADFIVGNKWKAANDSAYSTLAVELMGMTQEIHTAVKQ